MLCEKCKKNEATCHFRQVINGKSSEMHLCADCAADEPKFSENSFAELWSSPLESAFGSAGLIGQLLGAGKTSQRRRTPICPFCGAGADDVAESGMAGCAQCYDTFGDMLSPYIRRLHGNAEHTGRVPKGASPELSRKRRAKALHEELKRAVDAQEFERAAQLRDELKSLEM